MDSRDYTPYSGAFTPWWSPGQARFDERPVFYAAWMATPTEVQFPGGESWREVRARVLAELDGVLARHAGETAVVVGHGGALRAILATCLEMPDDGVFRLDQRYAAVNVVEWIEDTPIVRLLNALRPS